MSCGIGYRGGSDLMLLWLWRRLAAVALIPPLAWEPPYAAGAALKRHNKSICRDKRKENLSLAIHKILTSKCYLIITIIACK